MKIKISALSTYMITLNFIIFLNLLNMTYNFVRNITSDFKLIQYEGFVINDVEFNNLSFRIHTRFRGVQSFLSPNTNNSFWNNIKYCLLHNQSNSRRQKSKF